MGHTETRHTHIDTSGYRPLARFAVGLCTMQLSVSTDSVGLLDDLPSNDPVSAWLGLRPVPVRVFKSPGAGPLLLARTPCRVSQPVSPLPFMWWCPRSSHEPGTP
jgi:hypothetical protein